MTKVIDEETKRDWEESLMKKKSEKDSKEEKEDSSKTHGTDSSEQEKAAEWLTGGLESHFESSGQITPVLQSTNAQQDSLEDVTGFMPSETKKEKKNDVRMYETKATIKYEDVNKREIYEETPENLLGRIVRPMDTGMLSPNPKMERIKLREEMNERTSPEKALSMKYIEKKSDTTLPFMRKTKVESIGKYEF
jgi:hypothetical protein